MIKKRVRKAYRNEELDRRIRGERIAREATGLRDAKRSGVRAPSALEVDIEECSITMTYVKGTLARDSLDGLDPSSRSSFFRDIGQQIGLLHDGGLVHGDLTTSNIIISQGRGPFLLDFGMSHRSREPEDRGVDLHLLQRSIVTSHLIDSKSSIASINRGYGDAAGEKQAKLSFMKAAEISRRGRYYAIR